MRNPRSYYSASFESFCRQSTNEIIGRIQLNSPFNETSIQQVNTWREEVAILKDQFKLLDKDGQIIFEYIIPRIGKRVDAIILYKNIVFV